MKRIAAILFCVLSAIAALPAQAQSGRYPISSDQIAGAMARAGMQVSASQVSLPSGIVAATSAPLLTARSMQRQGGDKLLVRMECASSAQCLPFFAWVQLAPGSETDAVVANSQFSPAQGSQSSRSIVIKRGAPAMLLLDGDHVHIRIAVVTLENGFAGQTIRVTGTENRIVYAATVVDGGMLKGRL